MEWLKLVHGAPRPSAGSTFGPGDDVRVWFKLREQGKERLAQFEGVVIRVRGSGASRTFTVRRLTHGVGVERVFPMDAPIIDRVEVLRRGKVRRSRLYFLRRVVKSTRLASAEEQTTGSGPGAGASSGKAAEMPGRPERSEDPVAAGGQSAHRSKPAA